MILNLTNLLVGFALILISFTIFINYIKVNRINIYFFFIILTVGIKRFLFGLVSLGLAHTTSSIKIEYFILLFLSPPLLLLCLKSFMFSKPSWKELSFYSVIFFCVISLRIYYGEMELFFVGILFTIYSLFYYYLLIRSYLYFTKQYQSIFTKKQLFKVKQLAIWVLSLGVNNFVWTFVFIFNDSSKETAIADMNHSSVVLWLLFLIYLFFNPSVLYNDVMQKNDSNRNFLVEFNLWDNKAVMKLDTQDTALELIVNKNLLHMLEGLRNLKPEIIIHSNSTDLISVIAKQLNYPKSHLKFAMKYHCRFSQSDYLNLMRVIHSLTLINDGYLENYTLETLREVCHFQSRTSFYRHFKKHLGVSPSKYIALLG